MKPLFICNPGSCGGKSAKTCQKLFALLDSKRIKYDVVFAHDLNHAARLSFIANHGDCRAIVAVGGDGTINRVINGFYGADGNRLSRSTFGAIHTGSSPVFCRSYGIPTNFTDALEAVCEGRSAPVPIGVVRYAAFGTIKDENRRGQLQAATGYFACWANIGIGPLLAQAANSGIRSYIGDYAGTLVSRLAVLARYRPMRCILEADRHKKTLRKTFNITVGLTRYISSGMRLNHLYVAPKGHLWLMMADNMRIWNIPAVVRTLYRARPLQSKGPVSLSYAREISVRSMRPESQIEFDGDPVGFTPCRFSIADDPLDVLGAHV